MGGQNEDEEENEDKGDDEEQTEAKPVVKKLWGKEGVEDLTDIVHSGVRFKDMNNIFLVDTRNFYKIDISTSEIVTFED